MQQSNPIVGTVLPPAATADIREIDGRPALVVTDPFGIDTILTIADSHPGDACVTLQALISAAKKADDLYFKRELEMEYDSQAVTA